MKGSSMKKILILAGYYLPGVKGGGPIQAIKYLVEELSNEYEFYILAFDRDFGDKYPFSNIETGTWIKKNNVNLFYEDVSKLSFGRLLKILNSIKFDILYLNSIFSYPFSIKPYILTKFGLTKFTNIILAPRGSFSFGALNQKKIKKSVFFAVCKIFHMYRDVIWHATSEYDKQDIQKIFSENAKIAVVRDLTANYCYLKYDKKVNKKPGKLKLVYIARIHPIKNISKTLELLESVEGNVEFNIYGPVEDNSYWDKCKKIINNLSSNIIVNYQGLIPNNMVVEVYKEHHVAILLTHGENFGYSIAEALIGGCPIIISDRTPWRNLEHFKVGWDIPLEREDIILDKIRHFVAMDNDEYFQMSEAAFTYAKSVSNRSEILDSYRDMFENTYEKN